MSAEPVRMERRSGQRFEVHLPVSIQVGDRTVAGFTQDVSARGVFFYAEAALPEGTPVELTFTMPSEITLAESMRIRCQGRVLRSLTCGVGQKNGIAVHLGSYEYLPECHPVAEPVRVSPEDSAPQGSGAISH
jgi:PilZ domain-containing protein